MKSFETFATVESAGQVFIARVPFAPGTEVEVTISPKRRSATEFIGAWQRLCGEMRSASGIENISDEDIQKEIDDYRAGK